MNNLKILLLLGGLFLFNHTLYSQVTNETYTFELPPLDDFQHNKIPIVNGVNPQPAVYSMVNLNSAQLATASISLDEQSVSLAPLNLTENNARLMDLVIKGGLKDELTYFGAGFNLKLKNKNIQQLYNKHSIKYQELYQNIHDLDNPTIRQSEMLRFQSVYQKNFIQEFYNEFNRNQMTIHASGSAILFDLISGDPIDLNNDGVIDNYHGFKGFNMTGGFSYTFTSNSGVNLNVNYGERKNNATENALTIAYTGGSVTFSKHIILNNRYISSEEYLYNSFIPGAEIALAIEFEKAFNNVTLADNGIIQQIAISPILDLKIKPLSQFRFCLPIRKITLVDDSNVTRFTPVIQYNVQLSNF